MKKLLFIGMIVSLLGCNNEEPILIPEQLNLKTGTESLESRFFRLMRDARGCVVNEVLLNSLNSSNFQGTARDVGQTVGMSPEGINLMEFCFENPAFIQSLEARFRSGEINSDPHYQQFLVEVLISSDEFPPELPCTNAYHGEVQVAISTYIKGMSSSVAAASVCPVCGALMGTLVTANYYHQLSVAQQNWDNCMCQTYGLGC